MIAQDFFVHFNPDSFHELVAHDVQPDEADILAVVQSSETASSLQANLAKHTHERSRAILKSVTEAAKKYAGNNTGKVQFENETILIVGKK